MPEVEDLPDEVLQDPMFFRSNGTDPGRDGCRVPLPWQGDEPPFGFSPAVATASPWLPQPQSWGAFSAAYQIRQQGSMLGLYREALQIRRGEPALCGGTFRWLEAPELGGTFAETTIETTASLSHRARAFQALLTALRAEGRV